MHKNYSLISSIVSEFADELKIELIIEPEYGHAGRIKTQDGKIFYYRSTMLDINPLGASEIAKDKTYASFFMQQLGYPVPEGESFYSDYWCEVIHSNKNIKAAISFAEKLGFLVIVKPNSESQGRGVEKVHDQKTLEYALACIFDELKDTVAIIQRVALGEDYRIVVLEDEVLCAYRRGPLSVLGDGKNTIAQLLRETQEVFIKRGRDTVINQNDPRILRLLVHQGFTFETILPKGKELQLLSNANLSSGGQSEDVTSQLHPDYKKMAIALTHDMGLKFCGVDIITSSAIDEPMRNYVIIEINAAPGLDYYAESGQIQQEIVKKLYKKLILHLIHS